MCVGDVLTVTLSTNQSQPHESVFTLNVNSNVCNSGGGGGGIVSCREEEGNVTHHTAFSYYITALNPGIANIQGHTLYFGGEWYSITMTVTIRQCHTEGECASILKWISLHVNSMQVILLMLLLPILLLMPPLLLLSKHHLLKMVQEMIMAISHHQLEMSHLAQFVS